MPPIHPVKKYFSKKGRAPKKQDPNLRGQVSPSRTEEAIASHWRSAFLFDFLHPYFYLLLCSSLPAQCPTWSKLGLNNRMRQFGKRQKKQQTGLGLPWRSSFGIADLFAVWHCCVFIPPLSIFLGFRWTFKNLTWYPWRIIHLCLYSSHSGWDYWTGLLWLILLKGIPFGASFQGDSDIEVAKAIGWFFSVGGLLFYLVDSLLIFVIFLLILINWMV